MSSAKIARQLERFYARSRLSALLTAGPGPTSSDRPLESYRNDPVGFCADVLGVTLTPDQAMILSALPGRVKVNSGHNIGKSFLAACAVLWWFYTRPQSVVITTAPTERDVIDILWTEVRILHAKARRPLPDFFAGPKAAEMFDNEEHWARGYTARDAVSFQGRHRASMLFVFDECHDDQTEVLTENGWAFFKDLTGAERLMTMDPETGVSEYCLPLRVVKRPHDGVMYRYVTANTDFCVTPGHRMLWQSASHKSGERVYGPWRLTRMEELAERKSVSWMTRRVVWTAPEVPEFVVPALRTARKSFPDRALPMDDWLRFLGWYFSEGHLIRGANGLVYSIGLSQKDPVAFASIKALCERLGFKVSVPQRTGTPQMYFCDMQIGRWLERYGTSSLTKRCPDFLRTLCPRQIDLFLETYIEGDGSRYPLRDVIYTSSPQMASDLNELVLKTGVDSTITPRPLKPDSGVIDGRVVTSTVRGFLVSRTKRSRRVKITPKHIREVPYSGTVYCAELPRHNLLLTRRNGKVLWSGNCEGIPAHFWTVTNTSYKDGYDHGWLAIGNPVTTASQSYVEDRARNVDGTPKWKMFSLSVLNHPNVLVELTGAGAVPVPNAVSAGQIDGYVADWCDRIDPTDRRENDFEWRPGSGAWYRPGPQMLARAMGIRPVDGVDTVWGMGAWRSACTPKYTPEHCWLHRYGITIGLDCASFGDDYSCFHVRSGPLSLHHESRNGWPPRRLADRMKELCVEWAAWYNAQSVSSMQRPLYQPSEVSVVIELDVSGADVLDHCMDDRGVLFGAWGGLKVAEPSDKLDQLGTEKYANKRSEIWFEGAKLAATAGMDLSRLPQEVLRRLEDQLLTPSYKTLPAGARQVEAKVDIKKRLRRSPDDADSLLVCYANTQLYAPQVIWRQDRI